MFLLFPVLSGKDGPFFKGGVICYKLCLLPLQFGQEVNSIECSPTSSRIGIYGKKYSFSL